MRKILFGVMILLVAMIVLGYGKMSSFIVVSSMDDNEIKISASNASDSSNTGTGNIKIPAGSAIQVDATITKGKLIITAGDKACVVVKSGESFIDVPAGDCELFFQGVNDLTGEITLRALPKV